MIKTQYPYVDESGKTYDNLILTYSDIKMQIKQNETGRIFYEAVDAYPSKYTYTETDMPIPEPQPEPEGEVDYETAYKQLSAEVMRNENAK